MSRHDDTSSLNNAAAYILLRTARLLRFHLNTVLAEAGLNIGAEQWFILFKLWETPNVQQNALADPVLNDEPNITRMVQALEEQGLVVRTVDESDKRRKRIALSATGEQLMRDFLPQVAEIRRQVFAGIDDEQLEMMISMLHRIDDNVT